nr:MFS transporter [uncultured Psychroserpens sp.]
MQQSHSLSAFLYAISNGVERASYYGIRSILILYMVGESLQMERLEAFQFYGWLAVSFYFSKVFGALLGDLLIGNKTAILIGGLLQTLGCFLLCIESITFLYVSIALIVLGSGLYSPNVFGQFGKQYSNKPKIIDAGFTGYFFFINIGAFLGILAIVYLGNINFNYGFIFGGVLMLIATLIAYFSKDKISSLISKESAIDSNVIKKIVYVCVAIVFAGIFWCCYEIYYGTLLALNVNEDFEVSKFYEMTSTLGLVFMFILAILWTFIYTNQFSKFCIGFIFSAIAISLLISYPENPEKGSSMILIISGLLLTLGEGFISPMLYAITSKYSNPKYLAIFLSLVGLPILIFTYIARKISELTYESKPSGIFIAITSTLVLFGIIAFIMWFVQKRDNLKILSQNEIISKT